MKLDHPYAVKREVDETPVLIKTEKVIETSETTVKKEIEASDGDFKKERKIIWVVSETADD